MAFRGLDRPGVGHGSTMMAILIHDPAPEEVDPVLHLTVRAGLHAPAMARAFVRCAVELVGASAPEDAVLLTSEAVTNSVEHASTDVVEVSLCRHGRNVRVSVTDTDPHPPEMQDVDPSRIGGLGVRLIDLLAEEWGVEPVGADGKRVWFEVALADALVVVP